MSDEQQTDDALRSGTALRHITEWAQREYNAGVRRQLDALMKTLPPPKPLTLRQRIELRIEEARERMAEIARALADRIDPYA